jgi:hypothetical protein
MNSYFFNKEELYKEMNYQLELASSLNLVNLADTSLPHNEADSDNLLILCKSLFKLPNNKIFLQEFEKNQVNRARKILKNIFFYLLF